MKFYALIIFIIFYKNNLLEGIFNSLMSIINIIIIWKGKVIIIIIMIMIVIYIRRVVSEIYYLMTSLRVWGYVKLEDYIQNKI